MPRHLDQNFLADIIDRSEYPWPGYNAPGQVLGVNADGTGLTFLPPGGAGSPGPANQLTIGTVTQGVTAAATITGTSPAQVLNLVLPKGDKGDQGAPGVGTPGATGAPGVQGPPGPGTTPNEYGNLTEAKITQIQTAGVAWIFIVNPRQGANGDNRTNINVPASIAGDKSGHMLSWTPANGWVDYGMWTGVKGDPGIQGNPGAPGPAGPPPNIAIGTVTTGTPAVTISGSSPNYVMNIVLPPGTQGIPGNTGPVGPKATSGYAALASASINFAIDQADVVSRTVSGATTWTFTNPPAAGGVSVKVLELTNGGTGTQTWPTSVKWDGGVAPTLTVAGLDILCFYTRDGGVTYRGEIRARDSK